MSDDRSVLTRVLLFGLALLGPVLVLAYTGLSVLGFQQGGLQRVALWYAGMMVLPVLGAGSLSAAAGLLYVHRGTRRLWALPSAVAGLVGLAAGLPLTGLWTPRYPVTLDDMQPAATVRLPLDGPVLVAWGGDTVAQNYHAAHPDQRWAYDLLVAPHTVGTSTLSDYGCYGLPVLAPAAGTVVAAHDGEPDQDPSTFEPNPLAPLGNHVVLRLADTSTHLVLAHLAPGSVAVAVDQAIPEGTVLGRCGNSGNTSEPHVHVHHQRQPVEQVGFAEGLPLYFRDHDGPPMPVGGLEVEGDTVRLLGDRVEHQGAL